MAKPIDFSGMFRAMVAQRLHEHPDIDEMGAEELAEELYGEWAEAADARLGGLSPRQWFARMRDPREVIACMEDYACARMEAPELLIERILAGGVEMAEPLERLALDADKPAALRAQAFEILRDVAPEAVRRMAAPIELGAEQGEPLAEVAAGALGEMAEDAQREELLRGYEGASEYARMLILEVLCNFSGDDRIYMLMRDMLLGCPERRAFAAKLLGRLGDARAIEPLTGLIGMSDLSYFEYLEIRNAIEALGGEIEEEREFYGDSDYEYMRNLE